MSNFVNLGFISLLFSLVRGFSAFFLFSKEPNPHLMAFFMDSLFYILWPYLYYFRHLRPQGLEFSSFSKTLRCIIRLFIETLLIFFLKNITMFSCKLSTSNCLSCVPKNDPLCFKTWKWYSVLSKYSYYIHNTVCRFICYSLQRCLHGCKGDIIF